eukprot:jgi/Mesvir1/17323/Mv07716-RA.1
MMEDVMETPPMDIPEAEAIQRVVRKLNAARNEEEEVMHLLGSANSWLSAFPAAARRKMAPFMYIAVYPQGDALYLEGENSISPVQFLLSGEVSIYESYSKLRAKAELEAYDAEKIRLKALRDAGAEDVLNGYSDTNDLKGASPQVAALARGAGEPLLPPAPQVVHTVRRVGECINTRAMFGERKTHTARAADECEVIEISFKDMSNAVAQEVPPGFDHDRFMRLLQMNCFERSVADIELMAQLAAARRLTFLAGLNQAQIRNVCKGASLLIASKDDIVLCQGDYGDNCCILIQGSVSTHVHEHLELARFVAPGSQSLAHPGNAHKDGPMLGSGGGGRKHHRKSMSKEAGKRRALMARANAPSSAYVRSSLGAYHAPKESLIGLGSPQLEYFILQGRLDMCAAQVSPALAHEGKNFRQIVQELGPGLVLGKRVSSLMANEFFGDHALVLEDRRRTGSVIVNTASVLLVVGKATYDYVYKAKQMEKLTMQVSMLRKLPGMKAFSNLRLIEMTYRIRELSFNRGVSIVTKDGPAGDIFFVNSGSCFVVVSPGGSSTTAGHDASHRGSRASISSGNEGGAMLGSSLGPRGSTSGNAPSSNVSSTTTRAKHITNSGLLSSVALSVRHAGGIEQLSKMAEEFLLSPRGGGVGANAMGTHEPLPHATVGATAGPTSSVIQAAAPSTLVPSQPGSVGAPAAAGRSPRPVNVPLEVALLAAGEMFGEYAVMFGQKQPFTIHTASPVQCFYLPGDEFLNTLPPSVIKAIRSLSVERCERWHKRAEELLSMRMDTHKEARGPDGRASLAATVTLPLTGIDATLAGASSTRHGQGAGTERDKGTVTGGRGFQLPDAANARGLVSGLLGDALMRATLKSPRSADGGARRGSKDGAVAEPQSAAVLTTKSSFKGSEVISPRGSTAGGSGWRRSSAVISPTSTQGGAAGRDQGGAQVASDGRQGEPPPPSTRIAEGNEVALNSASNSHASSEDSASRLGGATGGGEATSRVTFASLPSIPGSETSPRSTHGPGVAVPRLHFPTGPPSDSTNDSNNLTISNHVVSAGPEQPPQPRKPSFMLSPRTACGGGTTRVIGSADTEVLLDTFVTGIAAVGAGADGKGAGGGGGGGGYLGHASARHANVHGGANARGMSLPTLRDIVEQDFDAPEHMVRWYGRNGVAVASMKSQTSAEAIEEQLAQLKSGALRGAIADAYASSSGGMASSRSGAGGSSAERAALAAGVFSPKADSMQLAELAEVRARKKKMSQRQREALQASEAQRLHEQSIAARSLAPPPYLAELTRQRQLDEYLKQYLRRNATTEKASVVL